jgi:hypothetical protein
MSIVSVSIGRLWLEADSYGESRNGRHDGGVQ